jgi:hypothetical protein
MKTINDDEIMGNELDQLRGKWNMSKNIVVPTNPIAAEARKLEEEKKAEELAQKLKEAHLAKQKEIEARLEGLELIPNGNRLILMPYPSNPYVKVVTDTGIFIEPNGKYFNTDTGEIDQAKELVACAKVVEIGPDVKYIKIGDDVYYDSRTVYPLPFMNLGYLVTSEPQIIAIINNDLKIRMGIK